MPDSLIAGLIAAPGVLASLGVVLHLTIGRYRRAQQVRREWPMVGESLGLESWSPPDSGRTDYYAGLRGEFRGRAVELKAGITAGSGQRSSATSHTTWLTQASELGLEIQHNKLLERMLPQGDDATGDAAFDKEFTVKAHEPQALERLSSAAREAVKGLADYVGDFVLDAEGLRTRIEGFAADRAQVEAVLEWHAHVLGTLGGEATGTAPARVPLARTDSCLPWLLMLGLIFGSLFGSAAYQAHVRDRDAGASGAPAEAALEVGSRVFADYHGAHYAGVVVELSVAEAQVVYLDGDVARLILSRVTHDRIGDGARVSAPLPDGSGRQEATVVQRSGDALRLEFGGGVEAWVALGQVSVSSGSSTDGSPVGESSWVLAPWKDEPWLYPATVIEEQDDQPRVLFHDNSQDTVSADGIRPGVLVAGAKVQVKVGESWVDAVVERVTGPAVLTERGWTALSRLRVPRM